MKRTHKLSLFAAAGLSLVVGLRVALAQDGDPFDMLLQRAQAEAGVVVVPDHFLRAWDPITVFFPTARGPAAGGPEHHPEQHGRFLPDQPGAWTWLDGRTLQFRPSEPWPALGSWSWEIGGVPVQVVSLMAAPVQTSPSDGATDLEPVDTIELTFAEALPMDVLARMTTVELRPLGQSGGEGATRLDASDFELKELPRPHHSAPASYAIRLAQPIPRGVEATVRLQLSVDSDPEQSVARIRFATAEPFRAHRLGCGGNALPVAPGGTTFPEEQALACGGADSLYVDFSAAPEDLDVLSARNLVRFEPAVPGLQASVQGRRLVLTGSFQRGQHYRVTLTPTPIHDVAGRALDLTGPSELSLWFAERPPLLGLHQGTGILERFGPQQVPVRARGHEQLDLRVYRVDPLNRSLWPFPSTPLTVNEDSRPPGPGEERGGWTSVSPIPPHELAQRLQELGTPGISERVEVPTRRGEAGASFGLDLSRHLDRLGGKDAPGHYLVGVRTLDGQATRQWMRVQVTDLSLTTVSEPDRLRFVVTRLSDGQPVPGAEVRLDGPVSTRFETIERARTGADGSATVASGSSALDAVSRVVVRSGGDVLVVDVNSPPDSFASGRWGGGRSWLGPLSSYNHPRSSEREKRCHIYTERPVYRPGDVVHIAGFRRDRVAGELTAVHTQGEVYVTAPGDTQWNLPAALTGEGDFAVDFAEDGDVPTGTYQASYRGRDGGSCDVSFRVEAFRLPTFEVTVAGPDAVPLDRPFDVQLVASYFAGGRVASRPVQWRVTQVPAPWSPPGREGFVFASEGRFGRLEGFRSSPSRVLSAVTDEQGHTTLSLDPSLEPTSHPRTYVVEATVTGADDQTVTQTRMVTAVPAVAVGLKLPRYLEHAEALHPEIIVVGHDGESVEGQEVTVRLTRREWHSHLELTDYTDGVARYVTDVVDVPVLERTVRSAKEALTVDLPVDRGGVYVVEVETHDRLQRASVVASDLYVGGEGAVAWEKPEAGVFKITPDKASYVPGERARLVLRSPYQEARALVITEAPSGNRYDWVSVSKGVGTVQIPVEGSFAPRLPVHVVLQRGRLEEAGRVGSSGDLGRPATVAATSFLRVEPVANQLEVKVEAPAVALPGKELPVTVRLATPDGRPTSGTVTLWLVDKAVLSLGKEQRLDPIPDFVVARATDVSIRDTRNQTVGWIPYAQMPGGDGDGEEEEGDPLDKATVRRDFRPVPFFQAGLRVPASGALTVKVQLPDDLTRFAIRVKATSGAERLGAGKGEVQVRLPLLVQPSLPRFVRPGDRFDATAIGRVVEGEGGPGKASARVTGMRLEGPSVVDTTWSKTLAVPVRFPVEVDTPDQVREDAEVLLQLGVSRSSDGAADAAEVRLPLRPDREEVVQHRVFEVKPGETVLLEALSEPARPGTLQRDVVLTDRLALAKMVVALDDVLDGPAITTEDRVARARIALGMERLLTPLGMTDGAEKRRAWVMEGMQRLAEVQTDSGYLAYWPGGRPDVRLTAAGLHLLIEAREGGFPVDDKLQDTLQRALQQSLRSDCRCFLDGESYYERSVALEALASTGRFDAAYWAELSRRASAMNNEAVAKVLTAGTRAGSMDVEAAKALEGRVAGGVIVRLVDGDERYGGLVETGTRNPLVLSSEARSLATMADALRRVDHPRGEWLLHALVGIGQEDGWGGRAADAAAVLALAGWVEGGPVQPLAVSAEAGGETQRLALREAHVASLRLTDAGPVRLTADKGAPGAAVVLVRTRYTPERSGAERGPDARGFAVERSWTRVSDGSKRDRLNQPGAVLQVRVGDVIEEHVQVVNAETRTFVAITVPLAAGFEVLNPALATAPAEARPSAAPTRRPDWSMLLDDRVVYVYERLPKGTYDFRVRTRATTAGRFAQPGASAAQLFAGHDHGASAGAWVEVSRAE